MRGFRAAAVAVPFALVGGVNVLESGGSATAGSVQVHEVVVELFTSQGCSSCPPADRLLAKLGAESGVRVVPLAYHVDFWNHGGWMDPFSSHDWTQRQVAYGRSFGLDNVYTPQAVVDGAAQLNGSDEARIRAAIASAAARPAAVLALALESPGSHVLARVDVDLPEALRDRRLDVWLAVYETGLVTAVARGENGGSQLQNDYVVRRLERAAKLAPGGDGQSSHSVKLRLSPDWKRSRLGVAAFVQDPRSLEIRGATARIFAVP